MSTLEPFLATVSPPLQPLVRELDALVRTAAPALGSSLKWGNLTYHDARNVCALVAHGKHVNLQLWAGAGLPDPSGVLQGTGKDMRHVKFLPGAPYDRDAVIALVRAAAAPGSRAAPREPRSP